MDNLRKNRIDPNAYYYRWWLEHTKLMAYSFWFLWEFLEFFLTCFVRINMVRLAIVYTHNIKDKGISFYSSYNALMPHPYSVCDWTHNSCSYKLTMSPVTIQSKMTWPLCKSLSSKLFRWSDDKEYILATHVYVS
jgi:hypothetical protein